VRQRLHATIVSNYLAFRKRNPLEPEKRPLRFFELASVLVRLDHVASFIVNSDEKLTAFVELQKAICGCVELA